ncbi:MAG: rhodanese-like domain-containing protein [Xanthomonadales bacterium]
MLKILSRALIVVLLGAQSLVAWADAPHWIDVRSVGEYESGHVEGAVNIPHTEIAERIAEVTEDKDDVIYVYCRSGRRSGIAQSVLENAGFTNVVNIGGLSDAQDFAAQERIAD